MDQVDTWHVGTYLSEVLFCTIIAHQSDLEFKVTYLEFKVTDLEFKVTDIEFKVTDFGILCLSFCLKCFELYIAGTNGWI